jgi:hypothetical protein
MNNIQFTPHYPVDGSQAVFVHRGYWTEIDGIWKVLKQKLVFRLGRRKVKRIIFTGHSHGGALAQMALVKIFANLVGEADDFKGLADEHLQLIKGATATVFGSPEVVGFMDVSQFGNKLKKFMRTTVVNYVHKNDPVPRCFSLLSSKMVSDIAVSVPAYEVSRLMLRLVGKVGNKVFGVDMNGLDQFINENQVVLGCYEHASMVIVLAPLLGEDREQWNSPMFDLKNHGTHHYVGSVERWANGKGVGAWVLLEGVLYRVAHVGPEFRVQDTPPKALPGHSEL